MFSFNKIFKSMEGLVGFGNLRNAEIKCLLQTSELQEAGISPLEKHSDFEFPNRLCLCLCIRLCVHHCQRLCRMIVADVLLFPTMFNMLITMTKS